MRYAPRASRRLEGSPRQTQVSSVHHPGSDLGGCEVQEHSFDGVGSQTAGVYNTAIWCLRLTIYYLDGVNVDPVNISVHHQGAWTPYCCQHARKHIHFVPQSQVATIMECPGLRIAQAHHCRNSQSHCELINEGRISRIESQPPTRKQCGQQGSKVYR